MTQYRSHDVVNEIYFAMDIETKNMKLSRITIKSYFC